MDNVDAPSRIKIGLELTQKITSSMEVLSIPTGKIIQKLSFNSAGDKKGNKLYEPKPNNDQGISIQVTNLVGIKIKEDTLQSLILKSKKSKTLSKSKTFNSQDSDVHTLTPNKFIKEEVSSKITEFRNYVLNKMIDKLKAHVKKQVSAEVHKLFTLINSRIQHESRYTTITQKPLVILQHSDCVWNMLSDLKYFHHYQQIKTDEL